MCLILRHISRLPKTWAVGHVTPDLTDGDGGQRGGGVDAAAKAPLEMLSVVRSTAYALRLRG